jgi:hypothetical protein
MPLPSRKLSRAAIVGPVLVLGAFLAGGLVLVELFVDPPNRGLATRLLAAVVLTFAALRIRTLVRSGPGGEGRSGFDAGPAAGPISDRCRFHQLHEEVRAASGNRRYFDMVAWPHFVRLARDAAPSLEKPRHRRFGRGPSLEALGRVIAAIEARR